MNFLKKAPDRKFGLHMSKKAPKGTRKNLILFQQWPLDWKNLFSAVAGEVAMHPIMGMLVPSSTNRSCLC